MRTKERQRDYEDRDEGPREAWSEIVPRLWMGGHVYTAADRISTKAIVADEFDVVYSLTYKEGYGPAAGVDHHVLQLPDDELTGQQIRDVEEFAEAAATDYAAGRRVLVRCWAGMNRSGLVVAEVLVLSGYMVEDAIALIRKQRSPEALNNEYFVAYLETGLVLAAEFMGLGTR